MHLHENLGLAISIAQKIDEIVNPKRNIVIDDSISEMGRNPGNLQMEIIADYMNEHWGKDYDLPYLYDVLEKWIVPIKNKFPWGFSIPYALSGKYKIHRTYAEFLKNKSGISSRDIDVIFKNFDRSEVELYNEKYLNKVYKKYILKKARKNE